MIISNQIQTTMPLKGNLIMAREEEEEVNNKPNKRIITIKVVIVKILIISR